MSVIFVAEQYHDGDLGVFDTFESARRAVIEHYGDCVSARHLKADGKYVEVSTFRMCEECRAWFDAITRTDIYGHYCCPVHAPLWREKRQHHRSAE